MAPPARIVGAALALSTAALASPLALTRRQNGTTPTQCPGYSASDIQTSANGLTARLTLAGSPCNVYGTDLEDLTLTVEYQTGQ